MAGRKATETLDPQLVVNGVERAMWAWLLEHSPVTVPALIEGAAQQAFASWLEANRSTLLEMIAEKVAKRMTDG